MLRQQQSDEDDQAARDHQAQGPHNGRGDWRRRAGPQPTAKTLYVVVTPELPADHEVSGAALAEWTKYAVPTPEMARRRWPDGRGQGGRNLLYC
jgi:hypothetical protein